MNRVHCIAVAVSICFSSQWTCAAEPNPQYEVGSIKIPAATADEAKLEKISIPLALDAAVRDGRIQAGQHVLMEGVGGGFTWGAALAKL